MHIKKLGLIFVLVLIVGCSTPKAPEQPEIAQIIEEVPEEIVVEEVKAAPADLEIILTNDGFDTKEVTVTPGSRVTIINEAATMHKVNGGEFFTEQFNTHLKSIYGNADPLERNKLRISIVSTGEYEIQDLTSRDVLKIISE